MGKWRSPGSFKFRFIFWTVLREIQKERIGGHGHEMRNWRIVGSVARLFEKLSKAGDPGLKTYAAFMGVSRPELVRWMLLCKERVRISVERDRVGSEEWRGLLAEKIRAGHEQRAIEERALAHHRNMGRARRGYK